MSSSYGRLSARKKLERGIAYSFAPARIDLMRHLLGRIRTIRSCPPSWTIFANIQGELVAWCVAEIGRLVGRRGSVRSAMEYVYASYLGRRLKDVSSKSKSHSLVMALFYLPLKKIFLAVS